MHGLETIKILNELAEREAKEKAQREANEAQRDPASFLFNPECDGDPNMVCGCDLCTPYEDINEANEAQREATNTDQWDQHVGDFNEAQRGHEAMRIRIQNAEDMCDPSDVKLVGLMAQFDPFAAQCYMLAAIAEIDRQLAIDMINELGQRDPLLAIAILDQITE